MLKVKINIVGDDRGGYTTEIVAEGKNVEILDTLTTAVRNICTEMHGGFGANMGVFTGMLLTKTEEVFADETDR